MQSLEKCPPGQLHPLWTFNNSGAGYVTPVRKCLSLYWFSCVSGSWVSAFTRMDFAFPWAFLMAQMVKTKLNLQSALWNFWESPFAEERWIWEKSGAELETTFPQPFLSWGVSGRPQAPQDVVGELEASQQNQPNQTVFVLAGGMRKPCWWHERTAVS